MKLYLVSQSENHNYDTYDSFVVAAASEDAARRWHPEGDWEGCGWCSSPDKASVKYIGEAAEGVIGIVISSYNAG